MNAAECKQQLTEITHKLNPILNGLGYVFEHSADGISSGGPFAAGFYANQEKKIGLIYRASAGLGSVNYEYGNGEIGTSHGDLMRYLGKKDVSKLSYDASKFLSYSKDGGSVVDALLYDIQNFSKDLLISTDEQFAKTMNAIDRTSSITSDSKIMNGVIIGMVIGGIVGYILQSLGWGIFIGFVVGMVGGVYRDWQITRKLTGR
jgi:F0F1-type ATP synthase assembly protein I